MRLLSCETYQEYDHANIYMSCERKFCELSLELVILEDRRNSLLSRREIKTLLKNAAGKATRLDAASFIAKELNIESKTIIPIIMNCQTGKRDVQATFYIYENEVQMKRLPRYRLLRNMPKAERKKLLDEEKAEKLKVKQSLVAERKTGAIRGRK